MRNCVSNGVRTSRCRADFFRLSKSRCGLPSRRAPDRLAALLTAFRLSIAFCLRRACTCGNGPAFARTQVLLLTARRCFGTQRSYHFGNVTQMVSYAAYKMPVFPSCQYRRKKMELRSYGLRAYIVYRLTMSPVLPFFLVQQAKEFSPRLVKLPSAAIDNLVFIRRSLGDVFQQRTPVQRINLSCRVLNNANVLA